MRKVTIEVTEEDIKNGTPGEPSCCAVALAAKRALGHEDVGVDGFEISLYGYRMSLGDGPVILESASLPWSVREFIDAFDVSDPVEPITFEAELFSALELAEQDDDEAFDEVPF